MTEDKRGNIAFQQNYISVPHECEMFLMLFSDRDRKNMLTKSTATEQTGPEGAVRAAARVFVVVNCCPQDPSGFCKGHAGELKALGTTALHPLDP